MALGLMKKKEVENEFDILTNDLLIVFNHDKRTSDINMISEVTADSVKVDGKYVVPIDDCEITTGRDGRNFFYRAPAESVTETQNLAQLEMNTVMRQMTAYREPILPASMDWTKALLFAIIVLALIIVAVVAIAG